jgi:putative copper export protein
MTVVDGVAGWVDLGTTVVLAGGVMYASLVAFPGPRGRRVLRSAVWLLFAALIAELAANTIRMHHVSGIGGIALVADVFEMKWSRLWLLRVAGLAAIGVGMHFAGTVWRALLPITVGWLLLRSLQGHAGAHGTIPALIDWAHLSFVAAWLGGLTQFALSSAAERRVAAPRLSRVATIAVAVVVSSGVYAALLHLPDWQAVTTSSYGITLLVKVALVAVLVSIGAVNHFILVPRVQRDDAGASGKLATAVQSELAIAAVILLLTALLCQLPMPHHMAP